MARNHHFGAGYAHFGENAANAGMDAIFYGDTAGRYLFWDASAMALVFYDNAELVLGTGSDVSFKWDATNLVLLPVADDTGAFHIGDGATDFDVKVFLSATTKYVLFDVGGALLTLEDVDLHLGDNDALEFGDAATGDVRMVWNATNLVITPAVDDTGAINIGDGTTDIDLKWFGGTSAKFVLFDVGNVLVQFDDVDLKLGDNDILQFGDAAGGDVAVSWNATNLVITPAVDDTGAIYFGNGTLDMDVRFHLGTTTDYVEFDVGTKALEVVGDSRIDLSSATVAAANTDGGLIKAGTSGARIVEDTADMRFLNFNFDSGATSGDIRGLYLRLYLTGAGGGGEAARIFTTVEDVAGGTAHGGHISLNFGASGSITGLGVASRNTLHIPNASLGGGTYAATQPEIYSDGASSAFAGTELSFIRAVNDGNATGIAAIDDSAFFFTLTGGASGSGNVFDTSTLRVKIHGTTYFVPVSTVANTITMPAGEGRIDLSNLTVAAGNTDGGVLKAGTSGSPVTEDTADMKFISLYWDDGATSGDARGIYNRLYITGAGGGGESFRTFTTVNNVAGATAHGAHISLSFGATGSITGLGVGSRNTLHLANQAYTGLGGTYAATQPEIWADGATTDPVGITELSLIRCVLGGNGAGADTGGVADIDDDAYLLVLDGGTTGSGNIVESSTSEVNYAYSIRCKINGTVMYLMAASAVG